MRYWTHAGNFGIPHHTATTWQTTMLTAEAVQSILDYACWPAGKPSDAVSMGVPEEGLTVFELVGAVHYAYYWRYLPSTPDQTIVLRAMVRKALSGKIYCEGNLNELYRFLAI